MGLSEYTDHGLFAPTKIAAAFRTTSDEVARFAGLGRDAVQRKQRLRSDKTQRRLREMIEVINKTAPRFGSTLIAYAWYRSEPLSGFSARRRCNLSRQAGSIKCLNISMRWMRAFTPSWLHAIPSCPERWCSFSEPPCFSASAWADHEPGTADSMTIGLSLNGAIVSSVM
jgi:hypothetical protein